MVDNNAEPGTKEEVAKTRARLVHEPRQGYGNATRRGLMEARGDLIILAEPDGTFLPEDILKLLVYSAECDAVFGTRTTRELIWAGANMAPFLRWGNWAVAKLIEALFNTSHLSDVGCTYRLLRKETARHVAAKMNVGGSHAGAEINYLPRVGTSSVTGSQLKAVFVGLRMIELVLRFRTSLRRLARPRAFEAPGNSAADTERHERVPL